MGYYMQKIYLDYNLFIYLMDNRNEMLSQAVDRLSYPNIFVYSPAHIEEVAVLNKGTIDSEAIRQLSFIENLTKCNELLPSEEKTILKEEQPITCYKRVINDYRINGYVEENERCFLRYLKSLDPKGSYSKVVSNNSEGILSQDNYHKDLMEILQKDCLLRELFGKEILKDDIILFRESLDAQRHFVKERILELAFNYLELIRYKPESIKKSRSRIHDCSHAIYASSADIFVTNDKRFLDKIKAVYNYFSINTKILSLDEFVEQNPL